MLTNTPTPPPVTGPLCPCGKTSRSELERISRGSVIKTFFFWLPIKRYKCYKCKRKKWILDKQPVKNDIQKKPEIRMEQKA
jgi:hypothetical protein